MWLKILKEKIADNVHWFLRDTTDYIKEYKQAIYSKNNFIKYNS